MNSRINHFLVSGRYVSLEQIKDRIETIMGYEVNEIKEVEKAPEGCDDRIIAKLVSGGEVWVYYIKDNFNRYYITEAHLFFAE